MCLLLEISELKNKKHRVTEKVQTGAVMLLKIFAFLMKTLISLFELKCSS